MAILTDTKARSIKPEDKPFAHGAVTGLTLHPSTVKGRGKWVFRYVSPLTKKRRKAGLGTYPEISIADAARDAQAMREQLANSLDPDVGSICQIGLRKLATRSNTVNDCSPHWSIMPFLPLVLSPLR